MIAGSLEWFDNPIGPWSEWIAAVLTVVAVVWSILYAQRTLSQEQTNTREALDIANRQHAFDVQRWQEDQDARKRAQAELVTITCPGPAMELTNYSATPIVDVRSFTLVRGRLDREDPSAGVIVEPGRKITMGTSEMGGDPTNVGDRIGFTFRDSGGRYWARYVNGALVSLQGTNPEAVLSEPATWPNH